MVTLRGTRKKKTFSAALIICLVVVNSNIGVDICTHVLFETVENKMNSMTYQRQCSFTAASYCSYCKLLNLKRK